MRKEYRLPIMRRAHMIIRRLVIFMVGKFSLAYPKFLLGFQTDHYFIEFMTT